jgi:hypothetical protein
MGWFMDQINRFICWTNRQPILQVAPHGLHDACYL